MITNLWMKRSARCCGGRYKILRSNKESGDFSRYAETDVNYSSVERAARAGDGFGDIEHADFSQEVARIDPCIESGDGLICCEADSQPV
jgi:hypothetical protein